MYLHQFSTNRIQTWIFTNFRGFFLTMEGSILHGIQKLNPKSATSSPGDSRFGVSFSFDIPFN